MAELVAPEAAREAILSRRSSVFQFLTSLPVLLAVAALLMAMLCLRTNRGRHSCR